MNFETLYHPKLTIQELCWHGDGVGISAKTGFYLDSHFHSIFTLKRWPQKTYPGIIHRLDTETSGAVVVARTAAAFETLKAALRGGRLDKRYLLLCAGQGLADEGSIEFPLTNHPKDQRRVYACIHPRDVMRYEPRPAGTRYRVLQRAGTWALVEASVGKALRHQIRAHFAAIGHPLAGDELYGGPVIRALGRHALHAARVAYEGGDGVDAFDASVPLPKDMAALLEAAAAGEDVAPDSEAAPASSEV